MSYDDYLKHHGILGMRWGRRNGPPYPLLRRNMSSAERREIPSSGESSEGSVKAKSQEKSVYVETSTGTKTNPGAKNVKQMSNEELKDSLDRMNKEKQYRELAQQDISDGKNFVKNLILAAGAVGVSTLVIGSVKKMADKGTDKIGNWFGKILNKDESKGAKMTLDSITKEFSKEDGTIDEDKLKSAKKELEMLAGVFRLRNELNGKGKAK